MHREILASLNGVGFLFGVIGLADRRVELGSAKC